MFIIMTTTTTSIGGGRRRSPDNAERITAGCLQKAYKIWSFADKSMKKPWLAALLALFLFPFSAGYIYLRAWQSAIVWVIIIWTLISFQRGNLLIVAVLMTTWDCYSSAKKYNLRVQRLVNKKLEKKKLVAREGKKRLAEAKFEAKQVAKGLVKFNGKWGTPEQVEKWKEIETGIDKNFSHLSHFEFENFIGKLFEKMGYETTVTRKTGDFGIDVIAKNSKDYCYSGETELFRQPYRCCYCAKCSWLNVEVQSK